MRHNVAFLAMVMGIGFSFGCKVRHPTDHSSQASSETNAIGLLEKDLLTCNVVPETKDGYIYSCGTNELDFEKYEVDMTKTNVVYIFTVHTDEDTKIKYKCAKKYSAETFEKDRQNILENCRPTAFQAWNLYFVRGGYLSTCDNAEDLRGGDGVCRNYARCAENEFLAVDNKCYSLKQPAVAQEKKCGIRQLKMTDGTCLDVDKYSACVFESSSGKVLTKYSHDLVGSVDLKVAPSLDSEVKKYCSRCANQIAADQPRSSGTEVSTNFCQ